MSATIKSSAARAAVGDWAALASFVMGPVPLTSNRAGSEPWEIVVRNAYELLTDIRVAVEDHLSQGADAEECIRRIADILESPDAIAVFNGISVRDGKLQADGGAQRHPIAPDVDAGSARSSK